MQPEQQKVIADVFARAVDLTIATNRADGWPQATTVSFVNDGLLIYFGVGSDSQKATNIARDRRVSVTVNAPYSKWSEIRGLSIAADAAFVTDPAELGRAGALMMKRFGGQLGQIASIDMEHTKVVRLRPLVISLLDYSKGFGHTELIELDRADLAA